MLNGDHIPSRPAADKSNKPPKPTAIEAQDALTRYALPRPATKEDLRERLVTIFRLAKAACDEEDSAESEARYGEEVAATDALIALEGDDIYMPAAKLIIANAGKIFSDINGKDKARDTRLNAEAAFGALRLFDLVDLYYECFPDGGIDAVDEEADAS